MNEVDGYWGWDLSGEADMEQGLNGVKLVLKVLRDYYASDDKAHSSAEGAGAGIP